MTYCIGVFFGKSFIKDMGMFVECLARVWKISLCVFLNPSVSSVLNTF